MKRKTENYLKLKDAARKDPQYQAIVDHYISSERRFAAVMGELDPLRREIVLDHLWVTDWAGRYLTLLA